MLLMACVGACSSQVADANLVTESTDFGNTFATRTTLPAGTTSVDGEVDFFNADENDFLRFVNLPTGANFTVDYDLEVPLSGDVGEFSVAVLEDGTGTAIDGDSFIPLFSLGDNVAGQLSGVVPIDGSLVLQVTAEFDGEGGPAGNYSLSVSAVPEPNLTMLGAAALLGAGGLRRRRRDA